MDRPLLASCSRTRGLLAMAARTRAFGLPTLPPHAPQSRAASKGLLSELLPWPQKRTSRAKFRVSPIIRSAVHCEGLLAEREARLRDALHARKGPALVD